MKNMKKLFILTLLLLVRVSAFSQVNLPAGSKAYGNTTYLGLDGKLWFGTNPLGYRSSYTSDQVDNLLSSLPAPTLQNVTTGTDNNVTTNVAWFTGLGNFTGVKNGVLIGKGLVGYYNPTDFPSEPTRWNITSINDGPTEEGLLINYRNGVNANVQLRPQTSLKAGVILSDGISPTGRLELADAINNTEATTLGQVNSLISGITGFVDLTTNQDINGRKTFKDLFTVDIATDDTDYRTDVVAGQYNIILRNVDPGTEPAQRKFEITDSHIELDMPGAGILMESDGIRMFQLAGTGTRMMTVDPTGLLGVTAIPSLSSYELLSNKQNSLTVDGSGNKYPTVDAINALNATLIHTTGNETKNGRLTLNSPTGTGGQLAGNSVSPLIVVGGAGGAGTSETGTVAGGSPSAIQITAGNGGWTFGGTTGTATSGSGAGLVLKAGDGGDILSVSASSKNYGNAGVAVLQAGQAYGTAFGGNVEIKAGNNITTGSTGVGGNIYMTIGAGNGSLADNPLYNGTLFLGLSGVGVVRGNTVVGSATDDRTNRFQVTGNSKFTGDVTATGNVTASNFTGGLLESNANSGGTTSLKYYEDDGAWKLTSTSPGDAALIVEAGIIATSFTGGATLTGTPTAPTPTGGSAGTQIANKDYVDNAIPTILSGSAVLDFPSTAAGSTSELTFTVTGAAVNDVIAMSTPTYNSNNVSWYAMVAGPNTVRIVFVNNSTNPIDPSSSLVFNVKVFK